MRPFHTTSIIATISRVVDVTTTTDANLLGSTDESHFDFARRANRIILTNDADFLRLASPGEPHVGIAYLRRQSGQSAKLRYLCLMKDCLEPQDMIGKIEFL